MAELESTKLHSYLKELFAADSQAFVRLTWFSRQAADEGRAEVASELSAIADRQLRGALGHLRFLMQAGDPITDMPIDTSASSIKSAVDSFNYDCSGHFQWMIQMARDEHLFEVADWLEEVLAEKEGSLSILRRLDGE